jgi:hypothetical protein
MRAWHCKHFGTFRAMFLLFSSIAPIFLYSIYAGKYAAGADEYVGK